MPTTETINIRCYQIGGTPDALLITLEPKEKNAHPKGIWLPKSQCTHITRHKQEPNTWQMIDVTIPEWLAAKKGLA